MRCEFHPEALAEYREAANWYENREPGVGLRFAAEVEYTIARIEEGPERWRTIDDDIRRCRTHVFPYSILYTIEPAFIHIVAIAHSARQPGYWKERISKQ
jgi:plasmid stabilization system protein ParE